VLNRRRQISELFNSGSRLRSRAGRALSVLVLAVTSPRGVEAERIGGRRADNQDRKNDDARNNRDTSEESSQSEKGSGQRNDGKASAETRDSGAKSNDSGKRDRNESTNENSETREQRATDGGKTRSESRRNSDSDSESSQSSVADHDPHQHAGRRFREFEQRADGAPASDVPDATSATPANPNNPNVVIEDIPRSPIADLVVNANDDVIASVSTSGGFAFARSGDVIAVSGPDGASIIQTGDVSTGTSGTSPAEPSADGGNNDVGFTS
jgi:hypothetical protein